MAVALLDAPADSLTAAELETVANWHDRFEGKYECIGKLIRPALSAREGRDKAAPTHAAEALADSQNELRCPVTGQTAASAATAAASIPLQPRREFLHRSSMPPFTAASLSDFDGTNEEHANAIYVSLRGLVYDVSAGREFWGLGGVYHSLAGRDVTEALAKRMLNADQLDHRNTLANELSVEEKAALDTHERQFLDKYPVVGRFEADSTASVQHSASRTFQLAELRRHNVAGHASAPESCPLLLAVRGKVFDVSRGAEFRDSGPFSSLPGHDCTLALAKQSTDPSLLDSSFEHLSFDELARLEAWTRQLENTFPSPGFIVDWEPVERMRESMKPRPFGTNLHTLIDQGDIDGVRAALRSDSALINQECARSGLTPLHKAAEAGDVALVRLLVSMGADRRARAPLYDNETPIEIARRFKHSLELIELLE